MILLFAMLAFGLGLMAHPVDMETAKELGGKFMLANHRSTTSTLTLAHTEKTEEGLDVCYVFNCQPKGFVIVAADDRMKPILGYSTESSFDLVAAEEGPRVFFDAYHSDLQTAIDSHWEQSTEIAEQWRQLSENGTLPHRGSRAIGPFCTSTWHQTQLYNDQCPEDSDGNNGHVKAGCVANAMAQIMRYWEWPKSGLGSHSYYCLGYGTLSANFAEVDYRYEFMPDFLDYTSSQYEVDAVALLEYHAGVSVNMSYGASASAALSSNAADAFVEYFRYSDQTTLKLRTLYSDARWQELMANEIDNGRPMYYSAYSFSKDGTRGAHAFVCDGYDEYDFFHFNWGWQGFDNGYYSVNGMDLTNHAYNYLHEVIVNLEPNAEYYDQPMPVSGVEIGLFASGSGVFGSLTAPTQTIGSDALASIDSIVLLANGNVFQVFANPQPGEELNFERFFDYDPGNLVCFEVYPVTSGGRGRAVIDNEIWSNSCKPITFQLHDATGNGWLSPAISVMDEQGVMYRIGLDDGYEGTVTVDVPLDENITLFWNYCNNGYVDGDEECRFEVYDYKGDLIYAQTEKPEVGELFVFFYALDYMIPPVEEQFDMQFATVKVFNTLGQQVYSGEASSMNTDDWKPGIYILDYTLEDGRTKSVKLLRP